MANEEPKKKSVVLDLISGSSKKHSTAGKAADAAPAAPGSPVSPADLEQLREMITEHYQNTSSALAKKILLDFDSYIPQFKKIMPNDYRRMLDAIAGFKAVKRWLLRKRAGWVIPGLLILRLWGVFL